MEITVADETWGQQATAFAIELATGKHHTRSYPWATVVGYLWGVTKHYESLDLPSPCRGMVELAEVLDGVHKLKRHLMRRVSPVTLNMLGRLALGCDTSNVLHLRNNLFYQMHFGTWARSASSLPKTVAGFDPEVHLAWKDVLLMLGTDGNPSHLAVGLQTQKQDPYELLLDKTGHQWHAIAATPGQAVNVCITYILYVAAVGKQPPDAPFFQKVNRFNQLTGRAATYSDLLAGFKSDLVTHCPGMDPKDFALHSFRRGGATTAREKGIADSFVQQFGGWSSEAFRLYMCLSVADQLTITRAIFFS